MERGVRPAIECDKDAFLQLALDYSNYNLSTSQAGRPIRPAYNEFLKARERNAAAVFDNYFQSNDQLILIAKFKDDIVGYALSYVYHGKLGFIDELYLREDARGLGLGNSLLHHTIGWMKNKGTEKMTLNVFDWNVDAMNFYEQNGFETYKVTYMKAL